MRRSGKSGGYRYPSTVEEQGGREEKRSRRRSGYGWRRSGAR
jgi:hypothetical protein